MSAVCLEMVLRDERGVDIPATIMLPDDRGSQPEIFISSRLVTDLFQLLDFIERNTDDEVAADHCRRRFSIMIAHGLDLEFSGPTSQGVH